MFNLKEYVRTYPFVVEYKDNLTGVVSVESWSERTLNEELHKGEVEILYIGSAIPEEDE